MNLSSKKHGRVKVYYYRNPESFHTYTLNGRTIREHLKWMYKHVTERTDIKKADLMMVANEDGVRMINRKTGGRMYVQRIGGSHAWFEDTVADIATMHEDYEYNK